MKGRVRKVLSAFLAVVLILTFSTSVFASNTSTSQPETISATAITAISTPENYEAWLKNESKTEDVSKASTTRETLATFQKLTKEQKKKFVDLLQNEELIVSALTVDVKPGESKSLSNGEVVVSLNKTVESELSPLISTAGTVEYRKATYQRTVSFFGIPVFQTTSWVKYSHNGIIILAIQGYNHFTSINYNPTLATSWSGLTGWYSTQTAYSTGDIVFSFLIEGYGLVYGSAEVGVWGDVYNDAGGWVTEY